MIVVDLVFRLIRSSIPVDHGYALYSAISRLIPEIHHMKDVGIHPIRGVYTGNGVLNLNDRSRLILRLSNEFIRPLLKLAGKALDVEGHRLQVGVCETMALRPVTALYSRLVTIKGFMEPEHFLEAAKRQLQEKSITAELQLGSRRTLKIKEKQVLGFEVLATGLTAEDSIQLQEAGIGGRRKMGCGVFSPFER
ncbi:MAG: type I-MYXAN CRISPR-associated protein Cas6/Cmx6 [Nitrospiria bacterium]